MRRLGMALGALAFLWACSATVYLLLASSQAGIVTSTVLAASGEAERVPLPLTTATGVWVTGLLICVTLLAGMPWGLAMSHPSGQRVTAWAAGSLLLGFCVLSGLSVGLPYPPSAILLIAAGTVGEVEPRGMPLTDSGA